MPPRFLSLVFCPDYCEELLGQGSNKSCLWVRCDGKTCSCKGRREPGDREALPTLPAASPRLLMWPCLSIPQPS